MIPDCQKPPSDDNLSDSEAESSVVEKVKLPPKAAPQVKHTPIEEPQLPPSVPMSQERSRPSTIK